MASAEITGLPLEADAVALVPAGEDNENHATGILDLPDEILENIFARVSPYNDLDSIRQVCKRWYTVSKKVISSLQSNFEQSVIDGNLQCEVISAPIPEQGQRLGSCISERFGHMCGYYDKAIYVVGGTTNTPTTFNDMWKFDLSNRLWSRCLASGQYPTPKALASIVQYKDNLVLFGGWAHPPPYPLMQPWRIFDELHIYNFGTNKWTCIVTNNSPHPSAGHSASVHDDKMVVFGGRTFDKQEQSFPISNSTWIFDFLREEWYAITTNSGPAPRYGQTQISLDGNKLLVVGGCGGPNQIFSDVWLLTFTENRIGKFSGTWEKMNLAGDESSVPNDFHYAGCKIGSSVSFFERSSPISPFLAFLHFESTASVPPEQNDLTFEASRSRSYFHSRCTSGLRRQSYTTMPLYSMDISKVLTDKTVTWSKEPQPLKFQRPNERLLYTMVTGRAEIILYGGFFKQPNGRQCQVSNDVFILKTVHRSY
ncbi:unnamed protein product [Orchesella dallaii]|uniref:F-box domain-containing protein n=1 Tax=Orchesella dallaii TaxID=48710 RepID=A0ABP1QT92_9HEXA